MYWGINPFIPLVRKQIKEQIENGDGGELSELTLDNLKIGQITPEIKAEIGEKIKLSLFLAV